LLVAQCAAAQEYCLHRERSAVWYVHRFPDSAGCHDPDAHHVVDPVTPAFQDAARSHSALQIPDDLLRRLDAFPFADFRPC
jgi:hypothetical protein